MIDPDELRKLAEAATDGPWKLVERAGYREVLAPDPECTWYGEPNAHAVLYCDTEIDEVEQDANARLIAYLRNAVPAILSQADENARLREVLEDVVSPINKLWRDAEAQGRQLSGTAYSIANDLHFVQSIARAALSDPMTKEMHDGR